jgi:hypothetical protein
VRRHLNAYTEQIRRLVGLSTIRGRVLRLLVLKRSALCVKLIRISPAITRLLRLPTKLLG